MFAIEDNDLTLRTLPPKNGDGFLRRERRPRMALYRSDLLPSLHLTFPGDNFNEYRLRQGCVEFRANDGDWRLLDKADIRLHFVLHTDVAKWLRRESAEAGRHRAAQG